MRMIAVEESNPAGVELDDPVPRVPRQPIGGYSTAEMMKAARGRPCPYCAQTMMPGTKRFPTRDHIRPRSAGGKLTPDNCVIVCGPCNVAKGSKSLERFAELLERYNDPRAPFVRAFMRS